MGGQPGMEGMGGYSAEDMKRMQEEQKEAQEQINMILKQTKPKNFRQGLFTGITVVVAAAIGAVGVAILLPSAGGVAGCMGGGIIGAACGCVCGAIFGACAACCLATLGACAGVNQICMGICALPGGVTGPMTGKWWNENDGEWMETDLTEEEAALAKVPGDDDDVSISATDSLILWLHTLIPVLTAYCE